MTAKSTDFILNSLKGKIWLAVGAMILLNCVFGLLAYLATSFLASGSSIPLFVAFTLSAATTAGFGWWLTTEILKPVDKVVRLAQSLERSPAASLPKTTGSRETDELLSTLHRNSQQLHNLIGLMDDVAAGKTDTALNPLQNSDRLSASFQKLVAKVTDSIDAKKDLIALQTAVTRLTSEVAPIRGGNLDITVSSDFPETKEITEALRFLLDRLNKLARQVHANTTEAKAAVVEVQRGFRTSIQNDESKRAKLNRAISALSEMPMRIQKISSEISESANNAARVAGSIGAEARSVSQCSEFLDSFRVQLNDVARRLGRLRDRSAAVLQIAKTAEDFARRTNLIALNTSIRSNAPAASGGSILAEEMASLSARAETINKEIASFNELLLRETAETETALKGLAGAVPGFATSISMGTSVGESLEQCLEYLSMIPSKLELLTGENSGCSEQSLRLLQAADPYAGSLELKLVDSEKHTANLLQVIDALQESILDFRFPLIETYPHSRPIGSKPPNDPQESVNTAAFAEQAALPGES